MKTIKVYQSVKDSYKDMKLLGKLKYIGKTFGAISLTNNKIYNCIGYDDKGWLKIVDDSDEDYVYSATNPGPLDGLSDGGKWEIVEIYDKGLEEFLNSIMR